MRDIIIILIALFASSCAYAAQDTVYLTVDDAIVMARYSSPEATRIKVEYQTKLWEREIFLSSLKPQLVFNAVLPELDRKVGQVPQSDGTVKFVRVANSSLRTSLSVEQAIALTGGTLSVGSEILRYDNIERKTHSYAAYPLNITLQQPVMGFNSLKWGKRIEPVKLLEVNRAFARNMELCVQRTLSMFYTLMQHQIRLQIAQSNLSINQHLLNIATERYRLGKISRSEVISVELNYRKSSNQLVEAQDNKRRSQVELLIFLGMPITSELVLVEPDLPQKVTLELGKVVELSRQNSYHEALNRRRLIEADASVAEAKAKSGVSAQLNVIMGWSGSSERLNQMDFSSGDRQEVYFGLHIPILDWGKGRARVKTAIEARKMVQLNAEQEMVALEREAILLVERMYMLSSKVENTKVIDSLARERFSIDAQRYVSQNISFTDFSIAQQEKDLAQSAYILSLEEYWLTFYRLRELTLFDFEHHRSLVDSISL